MLIFRGGTNVHISTYYLYAIKHSYTSIYYPDAACMDYLPTLGEKWPHEQRGNVGKYLLHRAPVIYIYISICIHIIFCISAPAPSRIFMVFTV